MRSRHEARRSVVGPEFIDHQDEAEKRPIGGFTVDIDVQVLRGHARPYRPRVERAQLEWPADDEAARLEQRREDVDGIELGPTVHEVGHPSRGAPDSHVVGGR